LKALYLVVTIKELMILHANSGGGAGKRLMGIPIKSLISMMIAPALRSAKGQTVPIIRWI
jgi:hypothetical protein